MGDQSRRPQPWAAAPAAANSRKLFLGLVQAAIDTGPGLADPEESVAERSPATDRLTAP